MTDFELLTEAIEESGKPMVRIAEDSGIKRETLYNRMKGVGEFTASEINGLTKALRLTKNQRDAIFFS